MNWGVRIVTGPEHDIKVNDKELAGFEQYLLKLAHENGLNWWELSNLLIYMAVGQVAAADFQAGSNEAMVRLSYSLTELYPLHMKALSQGDNLIANPADGDTIN